MVQTCVSLIDLASYLLAKIGFTAAENEPSEVYICSSPEFGMQISYVRPERSIAPEVHVAEEPREDDGNEERQPREVVPHPFPVLLARPVGKRSRDLS